METGDVSLLLEAAELLDQRDEEAQRRSAGSSSGYYSDASSTDFVVPDTMNNMRDDRYYATRTNKHKHKQKRMSPPHHQGTNSSSSKDAGKRSGGSSLHNEVEKRRRAHLAQCYSHLRDVLPLAPGSKTSNVVVLRSATEYIKELEKEEADLRKLKLELQQEREKLAGLCGKDLHQMGRKVKKFEEEPATVPSSPVPHAADDDDVDDDSMVVDGDSCVVPDNESRSVSPMFSATASALYGDLHGVGKKLGSLQQPLLSYPTLSASDDSDEDNSEGSPPTQGLLMLAAAMEEACVPASRSGRRLGRKPVRFC